MHLIKKALGGAPLELARIALRVERRRLMKRLWRGVAENGVEFGFELDAPLENGAVFHAEPGACYVIEQEPEALLEIPLDLSPEAAALIAWNIGNLHMPVDIRPGVIFAPEDTGLRQLLERLGIHFHTTTGLFLPSRATFGSSGHGHSHSHDHGHEH